MKKSQDEVELYTKFFHGLSNPTRYKILLSLIEGEKNVNELVEDLDFSQSLVSMQLKCLKWCNFVKYIKKGKHIYYSINDERLISLMHLGESIASGHNHSICTCKIIEDEQNSKT